MGDGNQPGAIGSHGTPGADRFAKPAPASSIAVPPSACTLTSCTPGHGAEASPRPLTGNWEIVESNRGNPFCRARQFVLFITLTGPALEKKLLPILNMPTRS